MTYQRPWLSYSKILALPFLLLTLVFWSCDDDSNNPDLKRKATLAITGELNDSLSFNPTFERLPDSSKKIPGPDTFESNLVIKGGQAPPDSFRIELYVLDQQSNIRERAYLVKQLTLENDPGQVAAGIVQTPNGSLYQTQLNENAKGTVVVNKITDEEVKIEIKGIQLSTGPNTITINGSFKAVSP